MREVQRRCRLAAAATVALLGCDGPAPLSVDETTPVPPVAECSPASPGTPIRPLLQQLSAADAATRSAAAWCLVEGPSPSPAVLEAVHRLTNDQDRSVRYAALWALHHLLEDDAERQGLRDTPPRPSRTARPVYPDEAFREKREGTVRLELLVGEDGAVAHAEIRASVPGLDAAALASAREWRFEPARRGGQPVAAVVEMPVSFRIH